MCTDYRTTKSDGSTRNVMFFGSLDSTFVKLRCVKTNVINKAIVNA